MDNDSFFREVTLRICSTLEIEQGLHVCFQYIKDHLPADTIYLEKFEPSLQAMRVIARANNVRGEKMDVLISIPDQAMVAMQQVSKTWQEGNLPPVLVINDPDQEPVTKSMLKALGEPVCSALSLPLIIDRRSIGALALLAEGLNRFNKKHTELFATLKKPFSIAMSNALRHLEVLQLKNLLTEDNRYLHAELRRLSGEEIVGANFGLKRVMVQASQVAPLDSPVLLLGETGVGKDIIANYIHYTSQRSDKPFVSVNCGAIPEGLIDSELFGHEKGAFTGALSQKRGRFERANTGTIFLDEVGELPPQIQVRLLRVLQNKDIERVGGTATIPLDIRIIAATNRDLENLVRQGIFREDLWFRLNVFPMIIPPLRERAGDIPALLQHFINQKSKEMKLSAIPEVQVGATEILMHYRWPGNVRELQNIVERALILNPQGPLTFDHLDLPQSNEEDRRSIPTTIGTTLDQMISDYIQQTLVKTHGKIHGNGGAAEILGINASTLRNRMNKLGIQYKKL